MTEQDRREMRKKLTAAWQAAAKRILDAGYEPNDVFETMAAVALDRNVPEQREQRSPPVQVVIDRNAPAAIPSWLKRASRQRT